MKPTIRERATEYLKLHGSASQAELAAALQVAGKSLSGVISQMMNANLLLVIPNGNGTKRNQKYRLAPLEAAVPEKPRRNGTGILTPRTYKQQLAWERLQLTDPASFRPVPAPDFGHRGKRTKPSLP